MSPRSKKEYAETIRLRYKKAARHEKTTILDEFCATCGHSGGMEKLYSCLSGKAVLN